MTNRRRTPPPRERIVVFICTANGDHPRRKLDEVALRDGVAVSVKLGALREAFTQNQIDRQAPGVQMSPFDLYCGQCGRHPQLQQGAMDALVREKLATHPDRMRVPHDISRP